MDSVIGLALRKRMLIPYHLDLFLALRPTMMSRMTVILNSWEDQVLQHLKLWYHPTVNNVDLSYIHHRSSSPQNPVVIFIIRLKVKHNDVAHH